MQEVVKKLLPIFILLAIGFISKQKKLFDNSFIEGLKSLLVNIALPAVLFDAFSKTSLHLSYLLVFVLIFLYCCILYLLGFFAHKIFPTLFPRHHTAASFTGFEFGMIGVGLFGAIWGMDALPVIMLIAFGHELFIWFIYVPLISRSKEQSFSLKKTLSQFLKTPTIIAILLGILVNLFGIYPRLEQFSIGVSFLAVIEFLKPLTSPLILIIIGYTLVFHIENSKEISRYIITRFILVLALGFLVLQSIRFFIPNLDPLFNLAFYAFILLPAPYILPLYIQDTEEGVFFTQLLVYSTILSFIGYAILVGISFLPS